MNKYSRYKTIYSYLDRVLRKGGLDMIKGEESVIEIQAPYSVRQTVGEGIELVYTC